MANLRISGETNADYLANLCEEFADSLIVDLERKVSCEEGLALGAHAIMVGPGTLGSSVPEVARIVVVRPAGGEVDVHAAALQVGAIHSLESLGGSFRFVKIDIAEAAALTRVLVGDDACAEKAFKLFEGLIEFVIVNGPSKAAHKERGARLGGVRFSLLVPRGGVGFIKRLALLGSSLIGGLGLLEFLVLLSLCLGLRFRGIRIIRVGVIAGSRLFIVIRALGTN